MRTPFKTLTVGLVLATAAMAGCSSTTGSSGSVQNAATASASAAASAASSSAASTSPVPSPDPVTPTAEPTEAPASPVASPTESSSASESPQSPALGGAVAANNDVCAEGLKYACGGIGASGVGTVFYATATPFACGANMASTCNYLEVAPNGWNGKLVNCKDGCGGSTNKTSDWGEEGLGTGRGYKYCGEDGWVGGINYSNTYIPGADGTVVGSGYANTSAMVNFCVAKKTKSANESSRLARGYTGGGQSDWSMPSRDELNALFYYPNRDAIGGFTAAYYFSSSQYDDDYAWAQDFGKQNLGFGYQTGFRKSEQLGVRPIRAF